MRGREHDRRMGARGYDQGQKPGDMIQNYQGDTKSYCFIVNKLFL